MRECLAPGDTHGGTVPNSLMFELDCTLEPFHVFARPRTRRSGPLGFATSTAGARSFLGACCEREKREGIAFGGLSAVGRLAKLRQNVDAVCVESLGEREGYRSVVSDGKEHGPRLTGSAYWGIECLDVKQDVSFRCVRGGRATDGSRGVDEKERAEELGRIVK